MKGKEYWRDRDKVNWDNSPDAYWNPITRREEAPLAFGAYFSRTREVMDTASATIDAPTWEEAAALAEECANDDNIEYALAAEIDTDFDHIGDVEAWYSEVGVDHEKLEADRKSAESDQDWSKIDNKHLWELPYADLRS